MTQAHPQVVIFVEDPGAANYAIPLADAFEAVGISAELYSEGATVDYLKGRGQSFIESQGLTTLESFSQNLRCLLFGTSDLPDSRAFTLMNEVRRLEISSFAFVDGLGNFANRFSGGTDQPFHYRPDFLLLPDIKSGDWAERLGFPRQQIVIAGNPYYDWILEKRKDVVRNHFTPPRTVGFFAEPLGGLNSTQFYKSEEYTLEGWGKSVGRNEIVLEEWIEAMRPWRSSIKQVLRLHPKNQADDFLDYHKYFDSISQGGESLKVIAECDLVVGETSIVLLEAALLGRPTLSIVPRVLERDWLSSIGWGMTPSVSTRAELEQQVQAFMTGKQKPSAPAEEVIGLGASQKIVAAVRAAMEKKGRVS